MNVSQVISNLRICGTANLPVNFQLKLFAIVCLITSSNSPPYATILSEDGTVYIASYLR